MTANNSDSFRYRKSLSQPMSELLADPFSELTRKRQSMLLIAATVALLLSAELVTVTEVGVAGIKFALGLPHLAAWLAFAITAYLLIAYLLGVWADWSISKAKLWSPLASVAEVKAGIDMENKEYIRDTRERIEKINRLRDERQKIDTEFVGRIDAISTRVREIGEELSAVPDISMQSIALDKEKLELIQERMRKDNEKLRLIQELMRKEIDLRQEREDLKEPLRKQLSDLLETDPGESITSMIRERTDISRTLSTFSNLTRLRLVIEILFPAAYAVFALLWTVHRN